MKAINREACQMDASGAAHPTAIPNRSITPGSVGPSALDTM
jgi:hypothetical protein